MNAPTLAPDAAREEFLKVAEVAARVRTSKMTIYRLIHSGELPAVRIGRSFRVPAAAVDAYLAASEVNR
jgi:excisionase family DNA binding protein